MVYTRYADDLTFSFNDIKLKEIIYKRIKKIVQKYHFSLNIKKTKLQKSKNGNVIITGVAVNENSVFPTRKIKRKIRSAKHQKNQDSLNGLNGWAMCNLPKILQKNDSVENHLAQNDSVNNSFLDIFNDLDLDIPF